ncbi:cytochrome P450 [Camillea tinctor]|nr:cytochrome P450 [Camillea tinctor]
MALSYVIGRIVYNVYSHPLRHYPGPKLSAASSILHARMIIRGQLHREIAELHAKYGDVVRITPNELSFVHYDAWKDIFGHRKSGQGEHSKDPIFTAPLASTIIGAGRDDHRRLRRILSHGFSAQAMLDQQPMINGYIDLLIRELHENVRGSSQALDMVSWYNWTTFDIMGDLAFGEPFGCLENTDYHPWVAAVFGAVKRNALLSLTGRFPLIASLLVKMIPRSVLRKAKEHDDLTRVKVDKRLDLGTSRPDFIQAMLSKGDLSMSKEEIYNNSGLIGAGSEATATALSGTTYLLTTHPAVLAKLTEEVRTSFPSESDMNIHSVQKLPYMLAVLDEALRLHPPSPIANLRRVQAGGDIICGQHVPDGVIRRTFYLPDSFIPERWLDEERFANDKKDMLQPFSYGPRNCIGKNLAYVEMRIVLARVLWNKDPLNVYLTPRKQ